MTVGNSNTQVIQGVMADDDPRNFRADASTHAQITIDYPHHEIHDGSMHSLDVTTDLEASTDFDILFITPNTTAWAHIEFNMLAEAESEIRLYEEPTAASTDGVALTSYNQNRNSTDTAACLAYYMTTVAVPGTLIFRRHFGTGKTSGGEARDIGEWILNKIQSICLGLSTLRQVLIT